MNLKKQRIKKTLNTLFPDNKNIEITPLKGRFYYGEDPPELAGIDPSDTKAQGEAIDKLGQNKLVKIVIKDLLNNKSFDTLEQMSKDRGTSLDILLKSYNLHNGEK